MVTPRVFVMRHGETEWSLSGRHTSTTDLNLTSNGEQRVLATADGLIGDRRLIVPRKLGCVYVSPRLRTLRTFELLNLGGRAAEPIEMLLESTQVSMIPEIKITDNLREWDYGSYEGLTNAQIQRCREGNEGTWNIWKDGCPGGESPQDVTTRLDKLIERIRDLQASSFHDPTSNSATDVLLIGHGHILRAFAKRWTGESLGDKPHLLLEAGGVGILSYEHGSIDEPAIMLGGSFVVDHV